MAKQKFYVVWIGRQTGVFDNWEACEEQVNGFSGAKFKSFNTRPLAESAFNDGPGRSGISGSNTQLTSNNLSLDETAPDTVPWS